MTRLVLFFFLSTMFMVANAFVVPTAQIMIRPQQRSPIVLQSALDDIKEPVQDILENGGPLVQQVKEAGLVSDPLLHWGHGSAMGVVLVTMAVAGAWMGWQIRLGNGDEVNAFTLGETNREHHPKVMGGAFLLFLIGGLLGFAALDAQGQNTLESPHAKSAVVAMGMLAVQAILPNFFSSSPGARRVHAYLGSATMVALLVHAINGIKLGLSF